MMRGPVNIKCVITPVVHWCAYETLNVGPYEYSKQAEMV